MLIQFSNPLLCAGAITDEAGVFSRTAPLLRFLLNKKYPKILRQFDWSNWTIGVVDAEAPLTSLAGSTPYLPGMIGKEPYPEGQPSRSGGGYDPGSSIPGTRHPQHGVIRHDRSVARNNSRSLTRTAQGQFVSGVKGEEG